jgi:hypothetical protein
MMGGQMEHMQTTFRRASPLSPISRIKVATRSDSLSPKSLA